MIANHSDWPIQSKKHAWNEVTCPLIWNLLQRVYNGPRAGLQTTSVCKMEGTKNWTLRRIVYHLIYLGIILFFMSRVAFAFVWWGKGELGTILKLDNPGHVVFPSFTICTQPSPKAVRKANANEAWTIPQPRMDILTAVRQTYLENNRHVFCQLISFFEFANYMYSV